ncbi:MAG: ABC transporter permease [Puniceicoccales bacterium]|jgi:lipoprotein-releasing system permease protein|nr:ABC transporter permease [Puniceicoccales bacterium]
MPIFNSSMWPIFLACRQLFPPRRFPVFAFVSTLGVAFGVTALLVVQTVMFSFGEEHRKRIRESVGDVEIHANGSPMSPVASLEKSLLEHQEVLAAASYIQGGVILKSDDGEFRLIGARGIDVRNEPHVTPLSNYLQRGKMEDMDDERVILGSRLARELRLGIGSQILLVSSGRVSKALDEAAPFLPKELEVCGIIHTGFADIDERLVLITLRTARELFSLPPGSATRTHVKLKDHTQAADFAKKLDHHFSETGLSLKATPWTDNRKAFLDAVAMEKELLFFLMFIIILVASFSIGSTLFNHVVRRTREIGLLGALGGRPAQILGLFLAQGLIIGSAGYALGTGLALLILHFRQKIIALMGAGETLLEQYRFDSVPLHYDFHDFTKTAVLTLVLMLTVSILPALWAARRKPSEAMRDAG